MKNDILRFFVVQLSTFHLKSPKYVAIDKNEPYSNADISKKAHNNIKVVVVTFIFLKVCKHKS